MLVVADSSPVIALIHAELIDLLPALFGEVLVPPQVLVELRSPKRSDAVQQFIAARPEWLQERVPLSIEEIPPLDAGETAAISLARELNADLLLIDESDGRKAAANRRIRFIGTIGVLERAAGAGLVILEEAFNRIQRSGFWISAELLEERLRLWRQRNGLAQ